MIRAAIDHLVVTAPSLAAGVEYVHDTLGVTAHPGGRHPRMGTHNALVKLDDSTYLEVLAVDPAARPPDHPRWFRLDEMDAHASPHLTAWVARVDDIHEAVAAIPALGEVKTMTRGSLEWLITVPRDANPSAAGVMPVLIQWLHDAHPAQLLENSGCSLDSLRGIHTDVSRVSRAIDKLNMEPRWSLVSASGDEEPGLVAMIRTRRGLRTLATAEGT